MDNSKPTYDVFVSHNMQDSTAAREIAQVMESYGLSVFTNSDIVDGERIEDTIWEAMSESQAFVAVIPEGTPSATIAFELGAAKAWNKPVYAIASTNSSMRLPVAFQGLIVYSPSRVEEIAQEIKRSLEALSDVEMSVLIEEFRRLDVSVDQLVLQPQLLAKLTKQFTKHAKRQIATEELVRLLLRLRKTGELGPHKGAKRARSR